MSEGIKHDAGKAPMHLMSVPAMLGTASVLRYGASKYAPRNWENGMDWSRVYAAAQRHMMAFWDGEDNDPESLLLHIHHAACNIMFLQHYVMKNIGLDDRPNAIQKSRSRTQTSKRVLRKKQRKNLRK